MKTSCESRLRKNFIKVVKRFFSDQAAPRDFEQNRDFILTNGSASYPPEFLGPEAHSQRDAEGRWSDVFWKNILPNYYFIDTLELLVSNSDGVFAEFFDYLDLLPDNSFWKTSYSFFQDHPKHQKQWFYEDIKSFFLERERHERFSYNSWAWGIFENIQRLEKVKKGLGWSWYFSVISGKKYPGRGRTKYRDPSGDRTKDVNSPFLGGLTGQAGPQRTIYIYRVSKNVAKEREENKQNPFDYLIFYSFNSDQIVFCEKWMGGALFNFFLFWCAKNDYIKRADLAMDLTSANCQNQGVRGNFLAALPYFFAKSLIKSDHRVCFEKEFLLFHKKVFEEKESRIFDISVFGETGYLRPNRYLDFLEFLKAFLRQIGWKEETFSLVKNGSFELKQKELLEKLSESWSFETIMLSQRLFDSQRQKEGSFKKSFSWDWVCYDKKQQSSRRLGEISRPGTKIDRFGDTIYSSRLKSYVTQSFAYRFEFRIFEEKTLQEFFKMARTKPEHTFAFFEKLASETSFNPKLTLFKTHLGCYFYELVDFEPEKNQDGFWIFFLLLFAFDNNNFWDKLREALGEDLSNTFAEQTKEFTQEVVE